jgi:hypothetical protein
VLILTAVWAVPLQAATSQNVTVTATPAFIAISNDPATWTVNGITGSGVINPSTTYWANPLGDTTSPTVGGAVNGECRFTLTNTSSVAIDLTVNFPNHTGGDASTNSNNDTPGATAFGARSYFVGKAQANWVIAQSTGSAEAYDNLAATTNIKWGMKYQSQTGAWTSGTNMTSTVVISAATHT